MPRQRGFLIASVTLALGAVALCATGVGGAGAQSETVPNPSPGGGEVTSFEAGATAEGIRFSVGAPGFAVVDTFVDGGGPVAQSLIDGLGNSRAFASLPYPGDLIVSGPGLLAAATGLPSPPPYPFYVDSYYPTKEEAKFAQPGYELVAKSGEQSSEGTASTGGSSGESGIGVTRVRAVTTRDPTTGAVTAEARGESDIVNIGGVLRIVNAKAIAKVTRAPGAEPTRESAFSIGAATISGQSVGISDKGFTVGPSNTPIPPDNPLIQALEQAKIHVRYLYAENNPDGVVSPGLVVTQEAQFPGGPLMVFRYTLGQMAAHATVSGSPTSIGAELPLESGPVNGSAGEPLTSSAPPMQSGAPTPAGEASESGAAGYGGTGGSSFDQAAGTSAPVGTGPYGAEAGAVPDSGGGLESASPAAPVAQGSGLQPASGPSAESLYLIIVLGAVAALGGGLVIRVLGVKLAWTS